MTTETPRAATRVEHLLPPNATELERALSASDHRVMTAPSWLIRDVWDPDLCPERLLPYLAQAWSVDEWEPAWDEARKRQAIKDAVWLHQHKGTIGALRRALALSGFAATCTEWWQPLSDAAKAAFSGREPAIDRRRAYTFRLYVALDQVTEWSSAQAARLRRIAIGAKNVRSLLEAIVLQRRSEVMPLRIAAGVGGIVHVRFLLEPARRIRPPAARVVIGAATYAVVHTRLKLL